MKKEINIIGAGFSGLTLAWFLVRRGFTVTIFEKNSFAGGLIQSERQHDMLVETAANGLMQSSLVEELFQSLDLSWVSTQTYAKKRFFWRENKYRQWPLKIYETLIFLISLSRSLTLGKNWMSPRPFESVRIWGYRVFGRYFTNFILATGLQGIYAGDYNRLSATLIFKRFFDNNAKKKKTKFQSIAPKEGMGDLMIKLKEKLIFRNVEFKFSTAFAKPERDCVYVSAVSAYDFEALAPVFLEGNSFFRLEMLPLIRVTVSFQQPKKKIKGFGILIDPKDSMASLGVLSNSYIFPDRGEFYNESWILGGAKSLDVMHLTDAQIKMLIEKERARILGCDDEIYGIHITRWSKALPHYTLELEEKLKNLKLKKNFYLTGNFLGRLGLSQILESNLELAQKIEANHSGAGPL